MMRKWSFGLLTALVLCLGLLAGTAEAAEPRTTQLKLTNHNEESAEEGWSWKKSDEDGYYTLTLNNVDFEVPDDSAIVFSMDKKIWLGGIDIVLIGENRVISTHQTENSYDGCGILLDVSSSYPPLEINISGGGSLTAEGYRCGISLAADQVHLDGVTVSAQSAYPSGLLVTNEGSLLIESSTVRASTISAAGLTSRDSDISVVLSSVPESWTYKDSLITAGSVNVSGGTLTLSGSEERPAYQAVSNHKQTSIDLTDCRIDIRNVEYGLHVNAGTINLTNVQGAVFCSDTGTYLYSGNPAFHANSLNASGCSVYAQTGMDLFIYGDCALPEELTEVTIPGDLIIEAGKTFTIGEGQKVIFSKDPASISKTDNTALVNNGTLEFPKQPSFRSGTKLINNGTLIAPEGISYPRDVQVTNNGTFDGLVKEKSGVIWHVYGNVALEFSNTLGGSGVWSRRVFVTSGAELTIPDGKTLDASQAGNGLTWDTLSEYLSVDEGGRITVEAGGQLLLPPDPTPEQLSGLPVTGDGTIKAGDALVCTVRFDSQGGPEVPGHIALSGQPADKPADPAKSGYLFGGWYVEETCETPWDFETDTVTANLTLYAKWTPEPQEPVTPEPEPKPEPKPEPGPSRPSGGTSSSRDDDDEKETRPPASTTTTTTQNPDGTTTSVTTDRTTGNVTTVTKDPGGASVSVTQDKGGNVTSVRAEVPAQKDGGTVRLPAEAERGTEIDIRVRGGGTAAVEIPAKGVTPGTVAVLVSPNGAETVDRRSVSTKNGMVVTVRGSAVVRLEDRGQTFPDVPEGWKAEAAAFASARKILNGGTDGRFRPDAAMTRAMLAVALHNLEGNPPFGSSTAFADVSEKDWYAEAVAWASAGGIVTGYTDELFGPNDKITREQLAVLLWRAAGRPAPSSRTLPFADADQAGDYARDALCWAVERGIINGTSGGVLEPKGIATRAQAAWMLKNYLENI